MFHSSSIPSSPSRRQQPVWNNPDRLAKLEKTVNASKFAEYREFLGIVAALASKNQDSLAAVFLANASKLNDSNEKLGECMGQKQKRNKSSLQARDAAGLSDLDSIRNRLSF